MSEPTQIPVGEYVEVLSEQRNSAMDDAARCAARALALSRENAALKKRIAELEAKLESHAPAA